MIVADTKVTTIASEVVPADVAALAGGLERLALAYDKLRRLALRDVHLNPQGAYLLRLAVRTGGVHLADFRQQLGITEPRASQIARALEQTHLVKRNRAKSDGRARVVWATDKGRKTLAKLDAQIAEALRAELAHGDDSPLQVAIAAVQLAVVSPAQLAEGHDDGQPSRHRKAANKPARDGRPTLWDELDNAQQSGVDEVGDVP
jgi:DNA-binding MarR family transcriptional regulator